MPPTKLAYLDGGVRLSIVRVNLSSPSLNDDFSSTASADHGQYHPLQSFPVFTGVDPPGVFSGAAVGYPLILWRGNNCGAAPPTRDRSGDFGTDPPGPVGLNYATPGGGSMRYRTRSAVYGDRR